MTGRIACAAALLALAGPVSLAPASPAGERAPSRLLVTAREYSLTLSRPKIAPGQAIVQLYDFGEDPHNLNLKRIGASRAYSIGDVEPGATGSVELKLRQRSRYRLWCSIANHADLGMVATLRTKPKRR
jgi:hypothetical protein